MGVKLIGAAYSLTLGDGITKAVLVAMADSGCNVCGLAWPGISHLERKTELGPTVIRKALASLTKQGMIRIWAYPRGGRGRSTEYRVLEQFVELSTPPCRDCQLNMKKPSRRGGYDKSVTEKPTATRGVLAKPIAEGVQNPPRGGDHPSVEPIPVSPKENSPPARHGPSGLPTTDAEWHRGAQEAAKLAHLFGPTPTPDRAATGKDGPLSAETEGRQGEAQGNGQAGGDSGDVELDQTEGCGES
jgi:hypothetical protein